MAALQVAERSAPPLPRGQSAPLLSRRRARRRGEQPASAAAQRTDTALAASSAAAALVPRCCLPAALRSSLRRPDRGAWRAQAGRGWGVTHASEVRDV
jgi:hypothetical protein